MFKDNDKICEEYILDTSKKQYKIDQDKVIHPRITYKNAFNALSNAFPQTKYVLRELPVTKNISNFDFSDGIINSHGKGATKDQAKASAIMEYIERFSWKNFKYSNASGYIQISYNELSKKENIQNIEKAFYIHYSNKKEKLLDVIKDINLTWIHGYSLTHNKIVYYPVNWINNYQLTNGLASGNTKEEAIFQGICELIERQNISELIYNYNNIKTELIDTNTINNPVIQNLLESFKEQHIEIYLINISTMFKVPTILAYGIDNNADWYFLKKGFGYGCHTDPEKAIIRALTEYYQQKQGMIEKKHRIHPDFNLNKGNWQWILDINIDNIINESPKIPLHGLPNLSNDDIKIEIETLNNIISNQGYEIILIDKTNPLINVPVYRVCIPGFVSGTILSTIHENDDLLIMMSYYQGGELEKLNKYYEEYFSSFIKNMELSIKIVLPSFNAEKALKTLNPTNCPLEEIFKNQNIESNLIKFYLMYNNTHG